ncbi:Putative glycosylphosphatidylinositol-mannosyltransferase I, PIG-X/PBN1 [Septoria linicola]|uniref:Protein PBN1 n=1 Tax=Septoria linicola TaxID=215465 RepID=A0A9Q9EJ63_9PEZI|nr:putative glycosylphosphatidylinositol-mannosyltransferase I, PIG-X/PBN1 [Septoria linicola]USW51033.1 Putative glycosylphosphatidylinositol-mannosyltransferase I, PIG-X/PBN1 [Septoria linicola]
MRQRITYILPEGTGVDPADINTGKDHLTFAKANNAAVERRITLGLIELPHLIQAILQDFHELHIRIVSPRNQATFSPAVSTLPPGLHAFFTPPTREGTLENNFCFELALLLGVNIETLICSSEPGSFPRLPVLSERFSSSSTYQYYHGVDDLAIISKRIAEEHCPGLHVASTSGQLCKILADAGDAAYVDYDFDVINHAVTISILSAPSDYVEQGVESGKAHKLQPDDRLEVGVLSPENADEPEELKMGGYLTVVGEDEKPSATLFSFPARHHPLPKGDLTTYTTGFRKPSGLHPKLDITFPAKDLKPPKPESCALHAYWTTPSTLFLDRYQLDDELFLASQNLKALRALSGEEDLEAPHWAVDQWGFAALIELAAPAANDRLKDTWTVTVPTHLRYLNASASATGHTHIDVAWPIVFWACEAEEGLKMSTNPFDRVNLGYDGLFGPKTMFYHVPASVDRERLVEQLRVPVLDPSQAAWIPFGTLIAVLVGFGWVCWKLFGGKQAPVVHSNGAGDVTRESETTKATSTGSDVKTTT